MDGLYVDLMIKNNIYILFSFYNKIEALKMHKNYVIHIILK